MLRRSRGHGAGRRGTWMPGERSAAWHRVVGAALLHLYVFFFKGKKKKQTQTVFAIRSAERLARVKAAVSVFAGPRRRLPPGSRALASWQKSLWRRVAVEALLLRRRGRVRVSRQSTA